MSPPISKGFCCDCGSRRLGNTSERASCYPAESIRDLLEDDMLNVFSLSQVINEYATIVLDKLARLDDDRDKQPPKSSRSEAKANAAPSSQSKNKASKCKDNKKFSKSASDVASTADLDDEQRRRFLQLLTNSGLLSNAPQ